MATKSVSDKSVLTFVTVTEPAFYVERQAFKTDPRKFTFALLQFQSCVGN